MYLKNFIMNSIRCSFVARNLPFLNGKSSCLICRKLSTAANEPVFRMESKTEKLYHDICKGERAALGENANLIHYASSYVFLSYSSWHHLGGVESQGEQRPVPASGQQTDDSLQTKGSSAWQTFSGV